MTAPDTGMNFNDLFGKHGGEAEPLAEGNYDVVVDSAKTKSSSDGSKPQVVIVFKIVDHPKFSNRRLTNTFTVSTGSEVAMNIFFRQMAALGFGGDFWAANPVNPLPTLAAQVPGRRARVQVKLEPYQGIDRPKIKNVMQASGAGPAGLGGGLPPVPGGLAPPPPVAQVPPVTQLIPPPAPPVPAPSAAPAPPAQEQTPAPAPAAPVVEQAPPAPAPAQEQAPAPAPAPAGTVPPAPAVPF